MFYAYLVPWFVAVWTASTYLFYGNTFLFAGEIINSEYDPYFDDRYSVLIGFLVVSCVFLLVPVSYFLEPSMDN
jgi:hypothetical protein